MAFAVGCSGHNKVGFWELTVSCQRSASRRDLEVRWHIFQHLTLVIADLAQPLGTTSRTGASSGVGDDLARPAIAHTPGLGRCRHRAWHRRATSDADAPDS